MGQQVAKQWVFGSVKVDTPSKRGFLMPVARRDVVTLLPILLKYVLPGSTLILHCWRYTMWWVCSDTAMHQPCRVLLEKCENVNFSQADEVVRAQNIS